jgi:hypothetical protein
MTHEVDKWDAEEWLQHNKDIWNHPMVTDRTDRNAYEVADLMAEFTNHIIKKQNDTRRKTNTLPEPRT